VCGFRRFGQNNLKSPQINNTSIFCIILLFTLFYEYYIKSSYPLCILLHFGKAMKMTLRMVTANRLHDGAVVYLAADDDWTRNVESGLAANTEDADKLMTTAEEAVHNQLIVAPYLIDVEVDVQSSRPVRPIRFREQIRAKGPTIFAPAAE
jgi:sulfite reductase (NADPH) hemoprotein beta-component